MSDTKQLTSPDYFDDRRVAPEVQGNHLNDKHAAVYAPPYAPLPARKESPDNANQNCLVGLYLKYSPITRLGLIERDLEASKALADSEYSIQEGNWFSIYDDREVQSILKKVEHEKLDSKTAFMLIHSELAKEKVISAQLNTMTGFVIASFFGLIIFIIIIAITASNAENASNQDA